MQQNLSFAPARLLGQPAHEFFRPRGALVKHLEILFGARITLPDSFEHCDRALDDLEQVVHLARRGRQEFVCPAVLTGVIVLHARQMGLESGRICRRRLTQVCIVSLGAPWVPPVEPFACYGRPVDVPELSFWIT